MKPIGYSGEVMITKNEANTMQVAKDGYFEKSKCGESRPSLGGELFPRMGKMPRYLFG